MLDVWQERVPWFSSKTGEWAATISFAAEFWDSQHLEFWDSQQLEFWDSQHDGPQDTACLMRWSSKKMKHEGNCQRTEWASTGNIKQHAKLTCFCSSLIFRCSSWLSPWEDAFRLSWTCAGRNVAWKITVSMHWMHNEQSTSYTNHSVVLLVRPAMIAQSYGSISRPVLIVQCYGSISRPTVIVQCYASMSGPTVTVQC